MANNKEHKVLNVPDLRFPEFGGVWNSDILGNHATKVGSGSTPKGGNAVYTTSGHPFVRSQNVGMGYLILDEIAHIDKETHQKQISTEIQLDDVLLNITGASIGRTTTATSQIVGGNVNQHVCIIRTDSSINAHFLCKYLQTNKIQQYIQSLQTGGSREGLNFEQIRKFPLVLPSCVEQSKINQFLTLIDLRISTQIKVIEDLKKLKSAISKRLFESEGSFPERIPLGSICALKNGYAFKSSSYDADGQYKIITIANVTGDRYASSNNCNTIISIPDDIQSHQVLKRNDILVSLTGNVGRVSYCPSDDMLLNQRVGLISLQSNINKEYIFQVLSSDNFRKSMEMKGQGAAQMNIGKDDVESYQIPWSNDFYVINSISRLLSSIDEKIIVANEILSRFYSQKDYLLRQMFI